MALPSIEPDFLARCKAILHGIEADSISPSSSATLVASPTTPEFSRPPVDPELDPEKARFLDNYADAFTDTFGIVGGAPFIYRNGSPWPKPDSPFARPYVRVMRPVAHTHPIANVWEGIVLKIEEYLEGRGIEPTIITGLSYGNAADNYVFCELAVVIGVVPRHFSFDDVKDAADHIKSVIVDPAGHPGIPVAFREWMPRLLAGGARLPALNPLVDTSVSELYHMYTSTLPLSVALEKKPYVEGTAGLFLRRSKDSDDILALTCAHVVCPDLKGLTITATTRRHQHVISPGYESWVKGLEDIMTRIATLDDIIAKEQKRISDIDEQLSGPSGDTAILGPSRLQAEHIIADSERDTSRLDTWHTHATKYTAIPADRLIGRVLCADPIGCSSPELGSHTIDWALIEVRKDAFDDDFKGNTVWIGMYSLHLYPVCMPK